MFNPRRSLIPGAAKRIRPTEKHLVREENVVSNTEPKNRQLFRLTRLLGAARMLGLLDRTIHWASGWNEGLKQIREAASGLQAA